MKNLQTKWSALTLLSALVLTLFCGCAQNQLQKAIDDFNSKCPMTIAMVARIMDASFLILEVHTLDAVRHAGEHLVGDGL